MPPNAIPYPSRSRRAGSGSRFPKRNRTVTLVVRVERADDRLPPILLPHLPVGGSLKFFIEYVREAAPTSRFPSPMHGPAAKVCELFERYKQTKHFQLC